MKYTKWWISEQARSTRNAVNRTVVIFIHGIFSDHRAFKPMRDRFVKSFKSNKKTSCEIGYVDYNYSRSMLINGEQLDRLLKKQFKRNEKIILVCHSMGGLIGRLAILSSAEPNTRIRKLIMLGTPNFGAMRSAQLSLLSQVFMGIGGAICGVFLRKPGLKELTDVNRVFEKLKNREESKADHIEYITIPGTFFNDNRGFIHFGDWGEKKVWKIFFGALNLGAELLTALAPLWKVSMDTPHDGIVEERSNCLFPADSGRWSEKSSSINHPGRYPVSYAHIEHKSCDSLTHVMIQRNESIIQLVFDLITADNLTEWYREIPVERLNKLSIKPGLNRG